MRKNSLILTKDLVISFTFDDSLGIVGHKHIVGLLVGLIVGHIVGFIVGHKHRQSYRQSYRQNYCKN